MSPVASSFIQPNVVPAGNVQVVMNAYCTQQQQQQRRHLPASPFSARVHGLYDSAGAGTHLVAEPTSPVLSGGSTMAPSIRNVSNRHWYPPGTDSRFSSKLLARYNIICA